MRVRRTLLACLALLAAAALFLPTAATVRAASAPTFGTPALTANFLVGIEIRQPVTLPAGVTAIEVRIDDPSSPVTEVHPIEVPAAGATSLSFTLDTPSGALLPNTLVTASFRVRLADGTVVDGPRGSVRYLDTRLTWRTLTGSLVRVHWTQGDAAFARRALDIGERAVRDISALLGVTETDPIDFYIYADRTQFYDVLGPSTRESVGGVALPSIRTLFANITPSGIDDPWVAIVVPHELAHVVFQTATDNPYHRPPRWLNEGLAVYLAQGYDEGDRATVASAASDGSLIPLTGLVGLFPTTPERFSLAYAESVAAVDHLVATYGKDALVALVRSYAGGVTDDEAFQRALGVDVAGFQVGWYDALGVSAPVPRGPQAAPAGPVPPGWDVAPATPAPTATVGPRGGSTDGGTPVSELVAGLLLGVGIGAVMLVVRTRRRPPPGAWS